MFSDLTIIILTHNRPQYLERIIDYYSNVEYKVLIADSSKKYCGTKIPSNFVYYHFENLDFFTKLDKIMQYVKTEYMLFCADDDFWVKESMAPCINFLDKNLDYSSIQGNYIGFSGYTENDFIPAYLHAQSIESSSIEKRLATNMKNYMPLFYAMHRTEVMKKVFSDRPWDIGNNPKTAVWEFLKDNDDFEIDKSIENKILITVAPDGYLKRVK